MSAMGYSSHVPMLARAVLMTTGDVLECGVGMHSTPLLHWMCRTMNRRLVSYDSSSRYLSIVAGFRDDRHLMEHATDWDTLPLERPWGVVFIDHDAHRRRVDARRVAPFATLVVVHDTEPRSERTYHLSECAEAFQYRWLQAVEGGPSTSVWSNTVSDLEDRFTRVWA